MQPANVRQALPSDAPGVSQLRLEALRDHPEAFSSEYEAERARSPAEWEAWVQRADGTDGALFLADVGTELAGMVAVFRGHSPKTQYSATLSGLYVRPAHRRAHSGGTGIGTQLVQACIGWAQARGVTILKLGVNVANTAAIQFYARRGFHVYGLEPRAIRVHNADGACPKDYDDLLMAIEL
jgi:ribosomal protein S18 acetylase RimI-like enzyme